MLNFTVKKKDLLSSFVKRSMTKRWDLHHMRQKSIAVKNLFTGHQEEWYFCRTSPTGAARWKAFICTCCNLICLMHILTPRRVRTGTSLSAVSLWTTGRGLSACSRHHGNALWRKTAEHHLHLLTRLQRPPETSYCRKWGGSSCLGKNEWWRPMTSCLLRVQLSSNVTNDELTYSPFLVKVMWPEHNESFTVSVWFKT